MAVVMAGRRAGRSANQFLRYGVPLISLVVLGYAGVGHLLQGRRDLMQANDDEEWRRLAATGLSREGPLDKGTGLPQRKKIDLEEELEKVKRSVNIDEFEYKPVLQGSLRQRDGPE
eukprot:TRINITY_DN21074_c0_g1_i1.p1 TRINITY_DN21074_c0_g1~~TRINITY_DN21074_c0_g1_i1.p1  ORF type:complete len:116 (-),score=17.65 TRINITY_DN21074_c0_g1_i1:647-994(-)